MELYAILRRAGWRSAAEFRAASARSNDVDDEQMPGAVRWIRSYVLDEIGGSIGTLCIYEASGPESLRRHAVLADLPVSEIVRVVETVVSAPSDPRDPR